MIFISICDCVGVPLFFFLYSPFQQPGQPVLFFLSLLLFRFDSLWIWILHLLIVRPSSNCLFSFVLIILFCIHWRLLLFVVCFTWIYHFNTFLASHAIFVRFFLQLLPFIVNRERTVFFLSLHIFSNGVYLIFHGARKKKCFFLFMNLFRFVTQKCMLFMHVWLANQQYHVLMFVSHLIQPKWNNTFTITATHCSIL